MGNNDRGVGCIYIVNEGPWIKEEAAPNIMQSECSCARQGTEDCAGIMPMDLKQENPFCQMSIRGWEAHSPLACFLPHCPLLILRKRKDETRFWSWIIIMSNKLNSVLLNTHMAHQECAHKTSVSKLSARDSQLVRSGVSIYRSGGGCWIKGRVFSNQTSFGAIRVKEPGSSDSPDLYPV